MRKIKLASLFFCLVLFVGFGVGSMISDAFSQPIDHLILYTEQYPPFNFESNGKLQGISVDLMVKILEKAGSKLNRNNIVLQPWARSYAQVQNEENVGLFAMTRSKEREKLFKWVGPIAPQTLALTALKSKHIKINSLDDIKKYSVGVIRDDISEQVLLKDGIPKSNLQEVAETIQNIRKLNMGRIDLWAYGAEVAKWELKSNGFNPDNYETIYNLQKAETWYAFNPKTSDSVITALQNAYNELVKDGEYQKILDSYLK